MVGVCVCDWEPENEKFRFDRYQNAISYKFDLAPSAIYKSIVHVHSTF